MSYDDRLGDYNDVASRMREFFEKYPDGRLRPAAPWKVQTIGEKAFVVFEAAAYRSADDPTPGIGTAWEPFPGRTPYTRDSELMNAETSAWGRAILAVGAADTKKGIASREEVRNRQAEREQWEQAEKLPTPEQVAAFAELSREIAEVATRGDIAVIGRRVKDAQAEGLITAAQYRALGVRANERIAELQQSEAA